MRFEYSKSTDGIWSWHLKSSVGEVVAQGGTYASRESCLSAIKLVKLAAGAACRDVSASAPVPAARAEMITSFQVQQV